MQEHGIFRYLVAVGWVDELSRGRVLSTRESDNLERVVRRLTPRRAIWRWKEHEDRAIKDLISRRKRMGRPKPFQRNDEIRLLAERLGRTEWAVRRRMERLRKCSDAGKRRKA